LLGGIDPNRFSQQRQEIMRESTNTTPNSGDTLLTKLNEAVAAANEAEAKVSTARAELVSRSKTVGLLLLDAKKLHPKGKDFEAFLKRVNGLKLSRAYDLMRLAGGRITDAELKKEARERQQRSRAKRKLPKPAPALKKPEPGPGPDSVTTPHVTESPEISTEQRRAENADLDLSAEERAAKASAHSLTEFTVACRAWLPKMTEADQRKALELVSEMTSNKPKAEAA
jgi:hypothetical protein